MKNFVVFLVSLLLLGASCSEKSDDRGQRPVPTGKVNAILSVADTFGQEEYAPAALAPKTRTGIIGDAGLDKVSWSETDKILLWATPDDGITYLLDGEQFHYYKPKQGAALFGASIPAMEDGTYTYYGAYPLPAARSGSQLTYNLPSEQDGTYNGALDIMLARPTSGSGLSEELQPGAAALAFAHKCHILRIQVPKNRNYWGVEARKLRIKFPSEVVGSLTFDALNPDAEPGFTNGSSTVTLNLRRPLDESVENAPDGNYVWVFLRPGVTLDGELTFHLYDKDDYRSYTISAPINKTLEAGKITPVTLSIPRQQVVQLDLNIVANNLGEDLTNLNLTTPEGLTFPDGTTTKTLIPTDNTFPVVELYYKEALPGAEFSIDFESENALLSNRKLIIPNENDLVESGNTTIPLTIPYLLEENFDNIGGGNYNYDAWSGSGAAGGNAMDGVGLAGWTGARWKTTDNTSLSISAYIGSTFLGSRTNVQFGRVDTCPLAIKNGKTISLQVSYNVSGKNGTSSGTPHCYFGTTTTTGVINGTNGGGLCAPDNRVEDFTINNGGSETNISVAKSATATGCTSATRLSWCHSIDINGTVTAKYFYIYIDNIKVSIVK